MTNTKTKLMKVGVIWVRDSINVGDDVQTLAMQEIVERIAPDAEVVWCDRESLHEPNTDQLTHLIVSGWFMKKPTHWPLHASYPNPLFVSFHVNKEQKVDVALLSKKHQNFWKSHEPIGCRDKGTVESFKNIEVDAWFSGCATLTFQRKRDETFAPYALVVDPFYHIHTKGYEKHQLKRLFGEKPSIELRSMTNADASRPHKSMQTRIQETRDLLKAICNSTFVLTSRIHIALPATALGIPVFFVSTGYNRTENSTDRFDGLVDLFHLIGGDAFPYSSRKRMGKLQRLIGLYRLENSDLSHLIPSVPSPKDLTQARSIAQSIEQRIADHLTNK